MMPPVYLDHNATTPVDPQVLDAMLPYLRSEFGNPSSTYSLGRRAREAIETARGQVADLISAFADEIVFTSGGTEASNIAIRGGAGSGGLRRDIVTTNIEHPATDACCEILAREGFSVHRVQANADGLVEPASFRECVGEATALVTVIHAQNEIGTLQPIAGISAIARRHGALMHADAAQSVGKIAVDVRALGVDLMSIAGHKLYAPKGVGAVFIRRGLDIPSVLVGAGQEHGRRPGTENVPYIVALGSACKIAALKLDEESARQRHLTDTLLHRLETEIPDIVLTGHREFRLPNTLNVLFPGVSGRRLLELCPEVMASNGSACHADQEQASAILTGIGLDPEMALGAVRLSVGRRTTMNDIEVAASALAAAWRGLHPQSGRNSDPAIRGAHP
ncbi:MAG: cysteine desulfurase [Bradyrhizobium sp.]|uniref:cysteine desulfurase family protein n=1 Tax=Bradyrhizobium sp. TaxID=376 RepID=UPI0025B99E10|nr:cysteine desulfurase family protein [Bradyrhizobium sp.]MBI5261853.1 cysteine desulfurase [Bradyrhizobium sp.]